MFYCTQLHISLTQEFVINGIHDPDKKLLQKELEDMIRARPGPVMEDLPKHEM